MKFDHLKTMTIYLKRTKISPAKLKCYMAALITKLILMVLGKIECLYVDHRLRNIF